MSWFTENKDGVTITVRVIPRASRSEVVGEYGEALKIKLASPPVDGAANEELVKLLSKRLDVPRSDIEIVAGHTSKLKRLLIRGTTTVGLKSLTK
jgi:uncharacterized protein (TIGR00251 family)